MLASVDCLFSFKLTLLVIGTLGYNNTFLLYTEHLGYYIMTHWILFKSSVLADLLWHCIGQERERSPCINNFLVGIDVQVPHQASFDTPCGQERTLHYCCAGMGVQVLYQASTDSTLGGRGVPYYYSPHGLYWHYGRWEVRGATCYHWKMTSHSAFSDTILAGEWGT